MSEYFVLFLIVVIVLAAVLQEDFILTLFYFVLGSYAVTRWWSSRALKSVQVLREFSDRAFINDKITVRLTLTNPSALPVVWLRLADSLPVEIVGAEVFRRVLSLGPRSKRRYEYVLQPGRRGYYQIGPLFLYSGDVLGLAEEQARQGSTAHLTVYPRVVAFTNISLPSRSPMGTLRHHQPIFEDPTRIRGKRDYVAGDLLRRVDWKASASTGRLQVKLFEPSIALETAIFLNLYNEDYYYRSRNDATELGIVTAASIASWVIGKKQTVGLATNGIDTRSKNPDEAHAIVIPPEKGRGHLMRLLDILACIQMTESNSFIHLLQHERPRLAWGTTVILITGNADHTIFDELFQMRRAGLNVVLILCGHVIAADEIKHRAQHFGIQVHQFNAETDLDVWRK